VKIGDRVRIVALPPKFADLDDPATQHLFRRCLGRTFSVVGFLTPEGLPGRLVELHVGRVLKQPAWKHSIWVEEEYLQPVE